MPVLRDWPRSDRFVLGPGLAAFAEKVFTRLDAEPVVNDPDQIPQPGREPRLGVPTVHQCPALALANEGAGSFEAIELPLDRIERYRKIPGNRTPVSLAMMKQRQQNRLGRLATEQVLKSRGDHDRYIRSNDR